MEKRPFSALSRAPPLPSCCWLRGEFSPACLGAVSSASWWKIERGEREGRKVERERMSKKTGRSINEEWKKNRKIFPLFSSFSHSSPFSPLLSSPNSGPPPAPERRRRATLSAMNSRPAALRCRAAAAGASTKAGAPMVSIRRPVAAIAPMALNMQQSKLSSAVSPSLQRKQQRLQPLASPPTATSAAAAAASSGEPPANKKSAGFVADRVAGLKALATPFSDPVSNGRLVALCLAQMLCSVATLIHDT